MGCSSVSESLRITSGIESQQYHGFSFSLWCSERVLRVMVVCTGGKVLMTIRIRADGNPSENSWKLFSGRGTEGTLL